MNKKIGQRKTEQRKVIYNIIKSAPGPLTVYDILEKANKDKKTTALTTVYRTVKLLVESDKVNIVTLSDGHQRYGIPSFEHRHHFHCKTCGIVLEIDHCCVHLHQDEIDGHLVKNHEITMTGVCKECR